MITPLRGPVAAGWNETLTSQCVDCESVVQLLAVTTNSALSLATALMLTLAAPMFVSVSVSGALVEPTGWPPKAIVPDPCSSPCEPPPPPPPPPPPVTHGAMPILQV